MSSAIIQRLTKLRDILTDSYNSKTKSLNTISEVENEIVNENVFIAFLNFTLATTLIKDIGIITPDDMDIRLSTALLISDVNFVSLSLFEGVPFTGDAEAPYFNANRQSDNEGTLLSYSTFTVAPAADLSAYDMIDRIETIGSGSNPALSSGSTQEGREFIILKRDTQYVFRFKNENGTTANVFAKEAWIETDLTD